MAEFTPFAHNPQSTNLDDLHIESDEDKIVVHGTLEILRDQIGLQHARRLRSMLEDIIKTLENAGDLPSKSASVDPEATVQVDNPFGDPTS